MRRAQDDTVARCAVPLHRSVQTGVDTPPHVELTLIIVFDPLYVAGRGGTSSAALSPVYQSRPYRRMKSVQPVRAELFFILLTTAVPRCLPW